MAKTGGWFKKLRDKQRKVGAAHKLGTQRAFITRPAAKSSTYAEKVHAFEAHKRSIHGTFNGKGTLVEEGGRNPQPVLTYMKRSGGQMAVCFRGDGHVDDSLQTQVVSKPKVDKRQPIASESKAGFKPRAFGSKKYGNRVSGCYFAG